VKFIFAFGFKSPDIDAATIFNPSFYLLWKWCAKVINAVTLF